jgi:hypothetical protein
LIIKGRFDAPLNICYAQPMTRVEKIEQFVNELAGDELAQFREWFAEYDATKWDEQISADVKAGRLDALIGEAKADIASGRTRPL